MNKMCIRKIKMLQNVIRHQLRPNKSQVTGNLWDIILFDAFLRFVGVEINS